ncbi:MAG: hypothetical protein H6742_18230 [Alphaproteobacteria bacterium]|nr:hypothetical protein [Alphaproteobacteria bacterium]
MDAQLLLIAALALLALVLGLGWWSARRRWSTATRRRVGRAIRGEADAESLLEAAGFAITDRQVRAFGWFEVDGEEVEFEVRADLMVEALDGSGWPPGSRLVAEVKTGDRAPNPGHPATRRQLLEYQRVFEPDGLLLVDVEAGRLVQIAFP